ncbi:MAG: transglycosylase SLT domain-containing protein [Syntrophorhabdales bacterium]
MGKKLDNYRLFYDNKGSMVRIQVWVPFLLAALIAAPLPCIAAVYTSVDEQGVVHFTNIRPAGKGGYRVLFGDRGGDEPGRGSVAALSKNTYDHLIRRHSRANGLDYRLVKAVMIAESNGNPLAVSHKGAQGLMQIMPDTALELDLRNPFDPEENIQAGTKYLRFLKDLFKGNLELILAAYNAGPQKVLENMAVPQISETINYVNRVKVYYSKIKDSP